MPGATSRMSRLPPHSPWPSRLVVTSRSGRDAERADERRDRPRDPVAEVQRAVAGRAARARACAGRSSSCSRRTAPASASIRRAGRAAGRRRSRSSRRPRCPRCVTTSVSPRSAPSTKTGPPIGLACGGDAVEAGPLAGDGLVVGRLEVAGAGVVGLDLERLAGLDAQAAARRASRRRTCGPGRG